ncbi:MAG: 16S rRNA (cytidine(1402)-2'-O)-methyltransferase [Actinobacteria bacterium]|nr:16S rRNA (cytidine(1402)-2'-O)-methyltransferase [Actinomycetota bacterium]
MSSRSASTSEALEAGGRLVVVSTPIGNLGDLSPRAAEALAGAGYIYCEDTRRTRKLLSHLGVSGQRLVAHHRFSEAATTPAALERLHAGATIALVSDAGTPLVSDPGGRLVRAAIEEGVAVEAVPGPSALLAALVVSGLATERWCFEGFLPAKAGRRATRLVGIAAEAERAVIVFEAPHRVARLLDELAQACGAQRPVAVCRELTKLHEEVWRGPVGEAAQRARRAQPRGEHVVIVGPPCPVPL